MNDPLFALGIGLAGATGLLLSGLASVLGRKGESRSGPKWGSTVGIGIGYLIGHAVIRGWFSGPRLLGTQAALLTWWTEGGAFPLLPGDAVDWLPWLAGTTVVLGVLDGWRPAPAWARWENRLLLTGLLFWLLLSPLFANTWEPSQGARWLAGLGLGILAIWGVLDPRAERLGSSMPLILLMMATASSLALILSHSIYLGLFAGALSASLTGVWIVSWFSSRVNLARGAIAVFVVLDAGLILCGLFYSELPRISALALAVAPLATYGDRIGPVSRLSGWKIATIRAVVLLIPLAVAVGVAIASRPEAAAGY